MILTIQYEKYSSYCTSLMPLGGYFLPQRENKSASDMIEMTTKAKTWASYSIDLLIVSYINKSISYINFPEDGYYYVQHIFSLCITSGSFQLVQAIECCWYHPRSYRPQKDEKAFYLQDTLDVNAKLKELKGIRIALRVKSFCWK